MLAAAARAALAALAPRASSLAQPADRDDTASVCPGAAELRDVARGSARNPCLTVCPSGAP